MVAAACLVPAGAMAAPSASGTASPTASSPTAATSGTAAASQTPTGPTQLNTQAGVIAQANKDAADRAVEALGTRVSTQVHRLAAASATAGLAEQRYDAQLARQQAAATAERNAAVDLRRAQVRYQQAQQALAAAAVAAYESDSGADSLDINSLGTLLMAPDPSAVLDTGTQRIMLVTHQGDVMAQMKVAEQNLDHAEATRASTLADEAAETKRLASIHRAAAAALTAQQQAVATLRGELRDAQATQEQADAALQSFLGGWSTADPKRAGELNQLYEKYALQSARRKPAPATAQWTAAMGRTVVARALQYLGVDYAWAAGNAAGPTAGTCVRGAAANDCHHVGFDCSGLALYSWAPYLSMAHFAATQYLSGAIHPAPTQLLPGDLVFWSYNATAAGIHHVAIYVGDGNVIQAPQSGDIVRITPLGAVAPGYFGATRPLT